MSTKEPDFRVHIDGRTHELRIGEITPKLAMEVRRETGMPLSTFLASPRDPDSLGVFVWLARRIAGEIKLPLDRVFAEVTLDKLQEGWEHLEAADAPALTGADGDEVAAMRDVITDPESHGADS